MSSNNMTVSSTTSSFMFRQHPPPPPPPLPPPPQPQQQQSRPNKQQQADKERDHEEPSSSTPNSFPDLEFDGTQVLCRVCGDKASGFHYGVHSCEGCKGFFRRSIQQKIQYRPCTKNQQCAILRINRNRCQYCRLKKCIAVGMSRDAVRFGRVPKREKAKILAAMQQSSNAKSQEKALDAELDNEAKLSATVIQAHMETCDYTREKVALMFIRALENPQVIICPTMLKACPLNPRPGIGSRHIMQDFSERFSPAIRGVVEFAKKLPGFSVLGQEDQVTLLKAGVFEVLLVRLTCMFNSQENYLLCLNGHTVRRDALHNTNTGRFLLDSMFDFADRFNGLRLTDAEIGLFCAIVVITADRPGLRNTDLVNKMHNKLRSALQSALNQTHPENPTAYQELMKKIHDLRTLNTLHSEKLLAYKMTEQQQQQQQQHQHQPGDHSPCPVQIAPPQNVLEAQVYRHSWEDSSSNGKCMWKDGKWSEHLSNGGVTVKEEVPFVVIDEASVKSPQGSVSSTESICSGEVATLTELPTMRGYHHHSHPSHTQIATDGMTATSIIMERHLAISPHAYPMPLPTSAASRNEMGHKRAQSNSEDECTSMMMGDGVSKVRKLDSPTDSGIESGPEKTLSDKSSNTLSPPTSLCSSPPSSMEYKVKEEEEETNSKSQMESMEDMPVLKRALQAPPLYDTTLLMDEAYKPHKKFRALRKDTPEPECSSAPSSQHPLLQSHLQAPTPFSTAVTSGCPSPVARPHSSSCASPPTSTNNHKPMSVLSAALLAPLSSAPAPLSVTHSTLAKSLMEGPKMTAEQMKRTDILHTIIMRGDDAYSTATSSSHISHVYNRPSSTATSSTPSPSYPRSAAYYIPQQQSPSPQPQRSPQCMRPTSSASPTWSPAHQSHAYPSQQQQQQQQQHPASRSSPIPMQSKVNDNSASPQPQTQILYQRLYYDPRTSSPPQQQQQQQQQQPPQQQQQQPVPHHPGQQQQTSTVMTKAVSTVASPASPVPPPPLPPPPPIISSSCNGTNRVSPVVRGFSPSPKMVELQVDIADSQPLNLSKKTPPPHKIPLEA